MKKRVTLIILITLLVVLLTETTAFAGIFHSGTNPQDLSLANLLVREENPSNMDNENLLVVAAMIIMAIIYMLVDKVKASMSAAEKT